MNASDMVRQWTEHTDAGGNATLRSPGLPYVEVSFLPAREAIVTTRGKVLSPAAPARVIVRTGPAGHRLMTSDPAQLHDIADKLHEIAAALADHVA